MFRWNGSAKAANAAAAATKAATQVPRSISSVPVMPSSASEPAKPRPHCVGMTSARAMPSSDIACQAVQFTATPPHTKGNWSDIAPGMGKRFMNAT